MQEVRGSIPLSSTTSLDYPKALRPKESPLTALVVFEDERHPAFEVVAALRGVFDLRCGARTLLDRMRDIGGSLSIVCRPVVRDLVAAAHPDATFAPPATAAIFVNARLLALGGDLGRLATGPQAGFARWAGDALVVAAGDVESSARVWQCLAARCEGRSDEPLAAALAREAAAWQHEAAAFHDGSCLIDHAWDLVRCNGSALCDDFRRGQGAGIAAGALVYPGVHLMQDGAIRIEEGCRIAPGTVLDAEDGPITLAAGVVVQPHVVVRGPAFIGSRSVLKAGAKIHEGTSLGPVCKVGGEVEESIVQGFSNKQHDGFLGHAWLGEWVNLGADTNNSDLKNNYSRVRMWEAGSMLDTGMQFAGLIAGDHVKSAIGTLFNTGTVVGAMSQIFGAGFPPKFVPPFSWGGAGALERYDWARAESTAAAVMQRRGITMTDAYRRALRALYDRWEGEARNPHD